MNNLERAQRDWETPPDDEEAKYCEECGEELEWKPDYVGKTPMCSGYWECTNSYCPEKFAHTIDVFPYDTKTIVEMANELVETKGKLEKFQGKVKYLENTNRFLNKLVDSKSKESEVVVRDTDYQIKRMEDAIQEVEKDTIHPDFLQTDVNYLRKEWGEIVKILRQR